VHLAERVAEIQVRELRFQYTVPAAQILGFWDKRASEWPRAKAFRVRAGLRWGRQGTQGNSNERREARWPQKKVPNKLKKTSDKINPLAAKKEEGPEENRASRPFCQLPLCRATSM
jgi:hypothetical protein